MKTNKKGGTLSSNQVLSNVEAIAYQVLDSYFDDSISLFKGGGGGNNFQTALQYQEHFSRILKGGNCDKDQNIELNTFTPPFTKPVETSNHTIDSNLHDVHVETYNLNHYSVL